MRAQKIMLMIGTMATLFLTCSVAMADTCFDPRYGYYECYPGYYYPADQAFVEGAFVGLVVGGFINDGNNYNQGHWNGRGYGGHGGGRGAGWGNGHRR